MARQTVDYGIDLGTTNSAIARMEKKGPRIVKSRYQSDTIPSAVAIGMQGEILVGEDALKDTRFVPARRFKRLMGTNQKIVMSDGSEWSPVDLSSEVLKELKASVQRRYDEDLTHAVITVPAMFQQPQCESTYQAAQKAGIEAVVLLQEPIAAATAYLSEDPEDGHYLVYDLGGGTFDVSLIKVNGREMHVIAHGGDNFLGGSDFDKRIAEWVIQQIELGYGHFPQINSPSGQWLLMRECELAKIRLTDEDKTSIDLSYFELPIARIDITRQILEDIIEDLVEKTIFHTKMRLDEARLTPDDIVAVLLVGGPTQMPYIRQRLRTDLGIETRLEDPMTVVALGAAIRASAMLIPQKSSTGSKRAPSGTGVSLELHYEPVSPDLECSISGKVVSPSGFEGQIRLSRTTGDWETGWIPLQKGAFVIDILLSKEAVTTFEISVRDSQGNIVPVSPDNIAIRWGTVPAKPIAPYHYGVALDDGTMDIIIEEGTPLPAYGRPKQYRTNRTINAGTSEEFVIYFLEGRSRIASDNIKVGELRLSGRDFPRTLKENERVEIRMRMDESRRLTARVYIPLFDQEFPVKFESSIYEVNPKKLNDEIQEVRKMIREIEDFTNEEEREQMLRAFSELERLEASISPANPVQRMSSEEASQRILHIKQTLRPIYSQYQIEAEYKKTAEILDQTEQLCQQFNDRMGQAVVQDLRKELDRCKRINDLRGVETIQEKAIEIGREHAMKTTEFWVALVVWLAQQMPKATNKPAYVKAIEKAKNALELGDIEKVRLAAVEAFQYLPDHGSSNPFGDVILRS